MLDSRLRGNDRHQFSEQSGEVSEWLKEHAWKVCIRQRIEGSNPSLSANKQKGPIRGLFVYQGKGGFDEGPMVRLERRRCERTSECSDGGPEGVTSIARNHHCGKSVSGKPLPTRHLFVKRKVLRSPVEPAGDELPFSRYRRRL